MVRFVAALSALFLVALSAFVAAGDAKKEPAPKDTDWKALFDGKSLKNWKATNFGGEGEIVIENGGIVIDRGSEMSGITYTGADFPKTHFEVAFEAKRTQGLDFFCTTTFPVGDDHCSLVVGGWAGSVVGLSSIDGKAASRRNQSGERYGHHRPVHGSALRISRPCRVPVSPCSLAATESCQRPSMVSVVLKR